MWPALIIWAIDGRDGEAAEPVALRTMTHSKEERRSVSTEKDLISEALQSHARQIREVWHERNEPGKTVAGRD
jgi:hypothetical protein